jgi:hypothetical protein
MGIKPCPKCGLPEPLNLTPDGIWYKPFTGDPIGIAYRCACGTNRTLNWADSTKMQRIEAFLADMAKDKENEMVGWGG